VASKEDIERFLHYISQLETSGGKNLNHETVKEGPLKGETAEGKHGHMPSTQRDMIKRYPANLDENSTPEEIDRQLAEHVLNRAKGDETLASGLWRHGHNRRMVHQAPLQDPRDIRNSLYAQEYDKVRSEIPYALDPNPYQEKYAEEQEEKKKFPQLDKLFKK